MQKLNTAFVLFAKGLYSHTYTFVKNNEYENKGITIYSFGFTNYGCCL